MLTAKHPSELTPTDKLVVERVFDIEAQAMLEDLASVPELMGELLTATPAQMDQALNKVRDLMVELSRKGCLTILPLKTGDGKLGGYAMLLRQEGESYAHYLHRIWIDPEYRRRGGATYLLDQLAATFPVMTLLSPPHLVDFFRGWFKRRGMFDVSKALPRARAADIYQGYSVMAIERSGIPPAPIIIMNNKDLVLIAVALRWAWNGEPAG